MIQSAHNEELAALKLKMKKVIKTHFFLFQSWTLLTDKMMNSPTHDIFFKDSRGQSEDDQLGEGERLPGEKRPILRWLLQ